MRGEWIEMIDGLTELLAVMSPLMRGEWIEILNVFVNSLQENWSPLMRGEWIEIPHRLTIWLRSLSPLMRGEWIEISISNQRGPWTRSLPS